MLTAVWQLILTDRSVELSRESSTALGQGCRLGFLGTLHMDVFRQRLEDEYDASVIITAPTVPYKGTSTVVQLCPVCLIYASFLVVYKERSGESTVIVSNPTDFPDTADGSQSRVKEILEPVVKATIIVPEGRLRNILSA